MKFRSLPAAGILLAQLVVSGCGENPDRTHNADLLDNKVLQRRVEAALRRGGADFQFIHVQADSGTVALTGKVKTAEARSRAEQISHGVYGVKEVSNEVVIAKNGPQRQRTENGNTESSK